jgi:hypothetical protein
MQGRQNLQTAKGRLKGHFPICVSVFINNIVGLIILLSIVDFQGRSVVLWVYPQKGEKMGGRRLVFSFILLGLQTIKRDAPRMVWVNSSLAKNYMHPLAVLCFKWWRVLHEFMLLLLYSRAETLAPMARRLQPAVLHLASPLRHHSIHNAKTKQH